MATTSDPQPDAQSAPMAVNEFEAILHVKNRVCGNCLNKRWFDCDFVRRQAGVSPGAILPCSNCRFNAGKGHCRPAAKTINDALWVQAHNDSAQKLLPGPKARDNQNPMPAEAVDAAWEGEPPGPPPQLPSKYRHRRDLRLPEGKPPQGRTPYGQPSQSQIGGFFVVGPGQTARITTVEYTNNGYQPISVPMHVFHGGSGHASQAPQAARPAKKQKLGTYADPTGPDAQFKAPHPSLLRKPPPVKDALFEAPPASLSRETPPTKDASFKAPPTSLPKPSTSLPQKPPSSKRGDTNMTGADEEATSPTTSTDDLEDRFKRKREETRPTRSRAERAQADQALYARLNAGQISKSEYLQATYEFGQENEKDRKRKREEEENTTPTKRPRVASRPVV